MSKRPKARVLNQDEVNKRIIARPPKVYPENEMIGPLGRYRDQNRAIYEEKRRQFLETANTYKKHNELALIQNKIRLGRFADDVLRYDFEKAIEDHVPEVDENRGLMLRKRTERPIHERPQLTLRVHCTEPWFRRHQVLCRFVWAARTVVLKNRLLKNLEKLKKLDTATVEELSKNYKKHVNISYADIFNALEEC